MDQFKKKGALTCDGPVQSTHYHRLIRVFVDYQDILPIFCDCTDEQGKFLLGRYAGLSGTLHTHEKGPYVICGQCRP